MLVLSRRRGECLRLGEDVEFHILDISATSVRIGIKAPKSLMILRAELIEGLALGNAQAAKTGQDAILEGLSLALKARLKS